MKAGRPYGETVDVGELLHALELVSVTPYGKHALSTVALPLIPEARCDPTHPQCLTVHCRSAGRYLRLHLTAQDARRLSHLLYYRSCGDPMADAGGGDGCSGCGS